VWHVHLYTGEEVWRMVYGEVGIDPQMGPYMGSHMGVWEHPRRVTSSAITTIYANMRTHHLATEGGTPYGTPCGDHMGPHMGTPMPIGPCIQAYRVWGPSPRGCPRWCT